MTLETISLKDKSLIFEEELKDADHQSLRMPLTEQSKSGNEVLLNVLLDSCISCNQVNTAIELFESLNGDSFFKPDVVTFNTLIKGCSIERRLEKALSLF